MKRNPLLPSLGAAVALSTTAHAAQMTWSLTPPVVDGADIANFTGAPNDAGNVNGGNDSGTYVANNQPSVGQTFTTGSNPAGYTLYSFTVQHAAYPDTATWSTDDGWAPFALFYPRIGTISGGTFTPNLANETAVPGNTDAVPGLDAPGQSGPGQGTGAYATFTFDSPVVLAPNTTYAFALWSNNPWFETDGNNASGTYAGGEAFSEAGGPVTAATGDHVFHLDIAAGADNDGDNLPDDWETSWPGITMLDQLDGNVTPSGSGNGSGDWDGDGLSDLDEFNEGTNPVVADTDGDGLSDGAEVSGSANGAFGNAPTNPLVADSDGDGLSDGDEVSGASNAFDGAPTNPAASDSDSDGDSDSAENYYGLFNPNSAASNPGSATELPVLLYQEAFDGTEESPVAEVTQVTMTGANATGLGGAYFDVYDDYGPVRFWYNVDGGSTMPPDESGLAYFVEVAISSGDPDTAIAAATETQAALNYFGTTGIAGTVVTFTDAVEGPRTDAKAGTSGFGVTVTTQGEPALPGINGKAPTVNRYGSANWLANSYLRVDGSVLDDDPGSALLPFDPQSNFRYRAKVDVLNASTLWLGLGFSQNPIGSPATGTVDDRLSDGPAGVAWMLIRNNGTDNDVEAFGGPYIGQAYGGQGDELIGLVDYNATNTLEVVINTFGDGSGFTTTYSVSGNTLYGGPVANNVDVDTIHYVGLTNDTTPDGAIGHDAFSLEWVFYDTDGDGLGDEWEINSFGNLTTTDDPGFDSDGDTLSNGDEFSVYFTNGNKNDSDDDGLLDPAEIAAGTNPNKADTDGDGLTDGEEVNTYSTDPLDPDSDADGYTDYQELIFFGTDPNSSASVPQFTVLIDAATRNGGFELVDGATSAAKVQDWDTSIEGDVDNWTQRAGATGDSGTEAGFNGRHTEGTRYAFLQPTNAVFNLTDTVVAAGDVFYLTFDQTEPNIADYVATLVYDSGSSGNAADIVDIAGSGFTGTAAGTGFEAIYVVPPGSPAIGKKLGVAFLANNWTFLDNVVLRKLDATAGPATPSVIGAGFSGANFQVTVANLQPGTQYFLKRSLTLSDGFPTVVDTVTAAGGTEVFTDPAPPVGPGAKAFYQISD